MDFEDDYNMEADDDDMDMPIDEVALEDDVHTILRRHQQPKDYTIVSEADIRNRQEDDITKVSNVLSLSRDSAIILLRHYNWDVVKVEEEWFADEEKVRNELGLVSVDVLPKKRGRPAKKQPCNICFENYPIEEMDAARCGHLFCNECWTGYVSTAINDGPGCLTLKCPDPSCGAAVGQSLINKLVCDEEKVKYAYYLVRSYIEGSHATKWCPAPGCDFAVDFEIGSDSSDVNCKCSHSFCWSCLEEPHRPMDCDTVKKWIAKNCDESENTNWILANSKPCPKCKRAIEKNEGCMHMTCRPPCRYQFCWLCLGDWSKHGQRTGGFYACNGYKENEKYIETEKVRQRAKAELKRYHHYYERWAANHSSRQKALEGLNEMQRDFGTLLVKQSRAVASDLKFIREAWLQIVECRRVLKWSYVYGFYLPMHESKKKELFEHLQGQAESELERLHDCAETELGLFYKREVPSEAFHEFGKKLIGYTKATRHLFENLVKALENGLPDIESQGACSEMPILFEEHQEEQRVEENQFQDEDQFDEDRFEVEDQDEEDDEDEQQEEITHWSCTHCTFANIGTADCQMCALPRLGGF